MKCDQAMEMFYDQNTGMFTVKSYWEGSFMGSFGTKGEAMKWCHEQGYIICRRPSMEKEYNWR